MQHKSYSYTINQKMCEDPERECPLNIKFYFKKVRRTTFGGVRLAFGVNYGNQINSGPFVSGLNFASKNSLAEVVGG